MAKPAKQWWFWMGNVGGRYQSYGAVNQTEYEAFLTEQALRRNYPGFWYRWRYVGGVWQPDQRSQPQFLASASGASFAA